MLTMFLTVFLMTHLGGSFYSAHFGLAFADSTLLYNTPMITGLLMLLAALLTVIFLTRILSRVETIEALRRSEERYRTLQNNVPVGLFRTNAAGKILSANRAMVEILHASSEEDLYHCNLNDICTMSSLREKIVEMSNIQDSLVDFEFELLRLDGKPIWALLSVRIINDKDGRPAFYDVSLRDITAQKQVQEALRASEETYRNLFQNAQVGLFRTRISDGKTLECNDQIARMFGYKSRDEAINNYFTEDKYIDPHARRKMIELLKKNGEFSNYEAELKRVDGGTVWIRFSAKSYPKQGWLEGVAEDITQQKLTELEMHKSERRFKDLADLLPQTIFEIDLEGNFLYVNKFGLKFSGYTEEDLQKGANLFQLLPAEEKERVRKNLQMRLGGRPTGNHEYKIIKKDGSIAYATIYVSIIFQDNIPIGLRGIVIDLTEKRKVQEFLNRAQRLETAGRIAGQVAHDFNNLLGPLVAYPDLIMEDLPSGHPIIPLIKDISSAAKQLSEINQQLLTLGRRGNYNQDPMNLNMVVEQVLAQIFPMPTKLQIQKNLEPDLMNIMGGESQVMRVVSNLVTNAQDAMQNIGLLTVSTKNVNLSGDTFGKWGRIPDGRYVRLTISDTGCGIAQDVMPKIFDPFFTTKRADRIKGSGLGLSTVFAVVEDHHGFIDCDTEVGKGTTFNVYFPATFEHKIDSAGDEIAGGTEKILVVYEDNEQRTVCMTLLNKLGYRTFAAEDIGQTLESLKNRAIDLLLLDFDMEGALDPTETYRRILEIKPLPNVILVTGYAESDKIKKALRLGAIPVLYKPLTIKSLAQSVRHSLDHGKTETTQVS